MLKNNRFCKGQNILDDSFKERMHNFFNPYEYNLESDLKDRGNPDLQAMKTKYHYERGKTKKS